MVRNFWKKEIGIGLFNGVQKIQEQCFWPNAIYEPFPAYPQLYLAGVNQPWLIFFLTKIFHFLLLALSPCFNLFLNSWIGSVPLDSEFQEPAFGPTSWPPTRNVNLLDSETGRFIINICDDTLFYKLVCLEDTQNSWYWVILSNWSSFLVFFRAHRACWILFWQIWDPLSY